MEKPEDLISISDPGEIDRGSHNRVDRVTVQVSNIFSWIYPILMLAIVSQVFLRSAGHNQAWLDDLQWWLYGAAVLVGIGYAVTTNSHVRVDIFHDNYSQARKNRIEIFALTWLFLPFVILSWDMTFHYAVASVEAREGSDSPNGLHRLYLLKVFMNVAFAFIGMAVWAAYHRYLSRLTVPHLWKQLLFAFPSTMFLVNLAVYYVLYWYLYVTGGDALNPRQIVREPVFEHTIPITIVATLLLIGLAWLLRRRTSQTG